MIPFTVAICAGGKSSRMGTDKAFVDLAGKPLIAHVLNALKSLEQHETILITNRADAYITLGLPMYADILPDFGALGGIYSAIYHSRASYTLVVGCDMPFVNAALVQYMLRQCKQDHDVVVPRINNRYEGLHAIYSRVCLDPIKRRLDNGELKVTAFFEDVRVHTINETECHLYDPDGLSFFNVNTPEQLHEALRLATSGRQPDAD